MEAAVKQQAVSDDPQVSYVLACGHVRLARALGFAVGSLWPCAECGGVARESVDVIDLTEEAAA
jgi:hypothetical protein